jgi:hypothetical protein
MAKKSYPLISPGQRVDFNWTNTDYKAACCDCGLVHRFRFKVKGKTLTMMAWRDNRATAQIRRNRPKSL